MTNRRLATLAGMTLLIAAATVLSPQTEAQNRIQEDPRLTGLPPQATRCDLSIPIHIALVPVNEPRAGQVTQFRVDVESFLDPDMVQSSWIEYELPNRVRRSVNALEAREMLGKARTGRAQLGVIIPDARRYEIRARYVVRLINGQTIAQSAVQHVNLGDFPPEGMVDRIIDPDGNGIRVFSGVTVRN